MHFKDFVVKDTFQIKIVKMHVKRSLDSWDRCFVVIAFKMIKMEFKFKYTILVKIVYTTLASLFH